MSIVQRFRDWKHERRIKQFRKLCVESHAARDRLRERVYWRLMVDAINARSPHQIARMERRMGLL